MQKQIILTLVFGWVTFFAAAQPLDDIVKRTTLKERKVLKYPPIREADVFWEKRIWRVLDTREKMNQPFMYPQEPFFKILETAALNGDVTLYSTENDQFKIPLSSEETEQLFYQRDTFEVANIETGEMEFTEAINDINWENIKRFRIKEVWFFDESTSTLRVRILGIAPLIDVTDEHGNFRHEKPLFWAYYPELRNHLARFPVFNVGNDAALNTWEDLFEMRFFSSYIYKESNVNDLRLQDYLSGEDLLLAADKIKQEIFNFEHDLWSY